MNNNVSYESVQSLGYFSYDLSLEVVEFDLGVVEGDVDKMTV